MSEWTAERTSAAIVVMAVAFAAVALVLGPSERHRIIIYGDSLSENASPYLTSLLQVEGKADLTSRVFGGTAICDRLADMRNDAATARPDAVIIEFIGNSFTPCTRELDGRQRHGPALVAEYARDAQEALALFTAQGTRVYLVAAPGRAETSDPGPLHDVYRRLAALYAPMAQFVDAGEAVRAPDGTYPYTLPCLPSEGPEEGCRNGEIAVRDPDRVHFCTSNDPTSGACPAYASGALRFAEAMAEPVRRDFRL